MEQPFLCISSALHKSRSDQEAVYDTDAPVKCSLFLQRALPFLSEYRHGTVHLPGNRFWHIYRNRTERYRTLWIRRICRQDVLLHTDRKEYDKALKHHKLLLNLANKYEVTFLIKAYNYLARDYEAVGDYKEAYFYIEKANKAIVEIEHRELVRKYVRVYKNYERLRGQEKEKHDFFATLSHELKTPINVIYSTIQLLNLFKDRDEQEFKNIYLKYEKSLKQNCLRMNRLVNNIIDLTKLDSGALNPNFVNYDIVKLTKDIAESVLSYVEINNVNLTFSSSIEEFIIICDPTFIERIVLNLLSNAIKFSKEKGNIDVNVYLKDKYVVLEVKDNGIGIPITMQQKIFERFVQLDKSLSRKKEGSGIGLSLVKILVEIHNGYIELESKEGNGSIFRVYLPNENDNSMIKVKSCNEYNVNIERVYAELSDIYELI